MIRTFSLLTWLLLLLLSCQSDIEWFGSEEGQVNPIQIEDKTTSSSYVAPESIDQQESKEEKGTTELILESSVTIFTKNQRNTLLGQGSGAFIEKDKIVTNYHVIESGVYYEVVFNSDDNVKYEATLHKIDKAHDVAILKIDTLFPEKVLKINKEYPKIGDDIIVAGSPMGLNGTVSKGNISAIRKFPPDDYDLFQISAPISPGSSGGPVVNLNAELIAISVSGVKSEGAQNLNFAVPAKYISFLLGD